MTVGEYITANTIAPKNVRERLTMENSVTVVFAMIASLADSKGVRNISKLPGLWSCDVDEKWKIELNGHNEDMDDVPPFSARIYYNGWPAGIISPYDGIIAAGEAANETTLIEALERAIENNAKAH